jgi:dGTPase
LQLTCATLAAFTKYPRESCLGGSRFAGVSAKKHGFFVEDRAAFEQVAQTVGLIRRDANRAIWCRHPLAFLVEAADDISYRVIDIEDGFRLGYFTLTEVLGLYLDILNDPDRQRTRMQGIRDDKGKVEFLRAKVISESIDQAMACFLDHEEAILAGRFDAPLLEVFPNRPAMDRLVEVARERIYQATEVVEIQAAGFQVIGDLLERFIEVLDDLAEQGEQATARSRMVSRLISEQFIGPDRTPSDNTYTRLLRLTDFVAGMTDSYAVSLYKKLTGISLPSI